jgi:hypothetical protein
VALMRRDREPRTGLLPHPQDRSSAGRVLGEIELETRGDSKFVPAGAVPDHPSNRPPDSTEANSPPLQRGPYPLAASSVFWTVAFDKPTSAAIARMLRPSDRSPTIMRVNSPLSAYEKEIGDRGNQGDFGRK